MQVGYAALRMKDRQKELVLRHLKDRGFTQSDVARACGISRQAVGQWVRGKTMPRRAHLQILAEMLGMSRKDTWGLLIR